MFRLDCRVFLLGLETGCFFSSCCSSDGSVFVLLELRLAGDANTSPSSFSSNTVGTTSLLLNILLDLLGVFA